MPPLQAALLSSLPSTLTCAGTTQAGAATVKSKNVQLSAGASQTGAILPTNATVGALFLFSNPNSTSALIYAPASTAAIGATTLNGAASTVPYTLAQNKALIMWQAAPGKWVSNPSP